MTPSPPSPPERERPLGGLVKHSAIYSAAPFLRQLISIGMTRLYTGWLGSSGYGVKEIADLWLIGLQQLLGANVLAAMMRFYFDKQDERDRARVVTSCTLLVTLIAFAFSGIALLFVPSLTPLMLGRGEEITQAELVKICQILLLLVPFQLGSLSGLYYLQILKRSTLYTTIQTAKLLFEVALNFVLIGAMGLGVYGFLLSMLIGEIVTSLGLCLWILWTLRPRVEWRVMPPIMRYAAPLVLVGLLQLALHYLNRRLLLELSPHGTAQAMTGVYGLGYRISFLVTTMMLGPFIQIWQPWIFGIEDERERAQLIARVGTYAVLAVAAASLGVILFGRQAAILLSGTQEFWDAYLVIPFVTTGYVFWALYHVSQTPLFIAKRTGRLFLINLIAVVINTGLSLWLIPADEPRDSIMGASISTLATLALLAVMGMLASHAESGVVFEVARLARIFAAVVLGGAFALWIDALDNAGECEVWLALTSKALAFPVLIAFLWFSVLQPSERLRFQTWLAARVRPARSG